MLITIAILLALIPAIAILYPFISKNIGNEWLDDESSPQAELERRWDVAVAGIRSAELEFSIGNLEEEDYRWLRHQYMREAAVVMRAMELEQEQEDELLAAIEQEVQRVREQTVGASVTDNEKPSLQPTPQESLGSG